jgi:hypothetical protein
MSLAASIAKDLDGNVPSKEIDNLRMRLFAMNTPVLHVREAIRVFQSDSPFVSFDMKCALLMEIWKKAVEIENYRIWNGLITEDLSEQCQLHEALTWRNAWVMASMNQDDFKREIQQHVDDGDVDGLISMFAGMYKDLEEQFNHTIEIVRNKQTNAKAYRTWDRPEDVKLLRIDLMYVKTRLPQFCMYCETFLNEENNWADFTGYNYVRNQLKSSKMIEKVGGKGILAELELDNSQYKLVEWPSDWNDRFCIGRDHPEYSHALTREGINYMFSKGVLINPFFPSMVLTILQKDHHYRSQIIRGLGEKVKVKDPTTGNKKIKVKFNTREIILAFCEGKDERIQSLIAKSTTRDPTRATVNDPGLYK